MHIYAWFYVDVYDINCILYIHICAVYIFVCIRRIPPYVMANIIIKKCLNIFKKNTIVI